jgi:hypothetical protein
MAQLVPPTTAVRGSYLAGETEAAIEEGLPTDWLQEAGADFAGFVERRRTVHELWGVPVTELWFVDGTDYLGTVIIRHRLTPALERAGGRSAGVPYRPQPLPDRRDAGEHHPHAESVQPALPVR